MRLIVVTGLSGSGKSVALKSLEDAGYYTIDNLPATLLGETVTVLGRQAVPRVAVSVDIRSAGTLGDLPTVLSELQSQQIDVDVLFIDASDESLIQRFSESRRPHPLAGASSAPSGRTLIECIHTERAMFSHITERAVRIDTTDIHAGQLRTWIRDWLHLGDSIPALILQSFAFKKGIPLDSDFLFDVRFVPNPYYDPQLKGLTGRDAPVIAFLDADASAQRFVQDTTNYLDQRLPDFARSARTALTVAIGCTGGQHRSVYMVERLAKHFRSKTSVLVRHRELRS